MFEIVAVKKLNPTVTEMEINAPLVAKKAQAGQFVIVRAAKEGERIPLTVADYDREKGTVKIIFQIVGATTYLLNRLKEGDRLADFVGPLGNPTHTEGLKKVAVVGGGVGCAIAYPVAKKLHEQGATVHTVAGFRNKDLVILEDEFKKVSDKYVLVSDDGTAGKKGLVTDALKYAANEGGVIDDPKYIIENGVCKLADHSSLAGSLATMDVLIQTMVKKAAIPLADAVRMASETPAKLIGIESHKGTLQKGKDADIVILDKDINVRCVFSHGKIVEGTNTMIH